MACSFIISGTPLGAMPAIASLAGLPVISPGVTGPQLSTASLLGWGTHHGHHTASPAITSTSPSPILATGTSSSGLPFAPTRLAPPMPGVYVGEGLPPVPSKLADKIKRWEYVEMSELLPEFWSRPEDGENKQAAARRRCQVTEIFTWVQCFCTYTSVLSQSSPETVPELLAYLVTITGFHGPCVVSL